jgi:hypothetical protein
MEILARIPVAPESIDIDHGKRPVGLDGDFDTLDQTVIMDQLEIVE